MISHHHTYTIRTMIHDEVEMAIDWAAAEGWNPGLHDADCFYTADPKGFFVGLLGDEPVAMISAVKYDDSFGFMGFYIVKPELRGKGYGIQIWNTGLAYLQGCVIGLDGVVSQQENYQKSGFTLAYRNVRYQGTGGNYSPKNPKIIPLTDLNIEDLCVYEKDLFPSRRLQFLKRWINQPQCIAVGIIENGKLAGYAVMRPCRTGFKIAPLYADNPNLANQLLSYLQSHTTGPAPIFIDIPEVNPAAIDLVQQHQMKPVFDTARMYTGRCPDLAMDRLFGVTSFELG